MTDESAQLGPSDDGTVMLDIGGDIGALVILTGESMHRAEIEISPLDGGAQDVFQAAHTHDHGDGHVDGHTHDRGDSHAHTHNHTHDGPPRTHVAVRERRGAAGSRYAAIYPGLREGRYTVWGLDGEAAEIVQITGGEVAQLDWR